MEICINQKWANQISYLFGQLNFHNWPHSGKQDRLKRRRRTLSASSFRNTHGIPFLRISSPTCTQGGRRPLGPMPLPTTLFLTRTRQPVSYLSVSLNLHDLAM